VTVDYPTVGEFCTLLAHLQKAVPSYTRHLMIVKREQGMILLGWPEGFCAFPAEGPEDFWGTTDSPGMLRLLRMGCKKDLLKFAVAPGELRLQRGEHSLVLRAVCHEHTESVAATLATQKARLRIILCASPSARLVEPGVEQWQAVRRALPFAAAERGRYAINGVYLSPPDWKPGRIGADCSQVVATNGRSLYCETVPTSWDGAGVILSGPMLRLLEALKKRPLAVVRDLPEDATVTPTSTAILDWGRVTYPDEHGTFPKYAQVMQTGDEITEALVVLDSEALWQSITQAVKEASDPMEIGVGNVRVVVDVQGCTVRPRFSKLPPRPLAGVQAASTGVHYEGWWGPEVYDSLRVLRGTFPVWRRKLPDGQMVRLSKDGNELGEMLWAACGQFGKQRTIYTMTQSEK
jgi:hypothetical protein